MTIAHYIALVATFVRVQRKVGISVSGVRDREERPERRTIIEGSWHVATWSGRAIADRPDG
jgi:hypothetical protein